MAITAFSMPGPNAAAKASARISRGNARKMSVSRIRTASTQPPKYPAGSPISRPIGTTIRLTSTTMVSVMRAPNAMRAMMSRPSSSVPKGCAQENGCNRSSSTWVSAVDGSATNGAAMAITTNRTTIASPTMPSVLRWKASQARNQPPSRA